MHVVGYRVTVGPLMYGMNTIIYVYVCVDTYTDIYCIYTVYTHILHTKYDLHVVLVEGTFEIAIFEVIRILLMTTKVIRDMTPCRMANSYQQFGRYCCLHL